MQLILTEIFAVGDIQPKVQQSVIYSWPSLVIEKSSSSKIQQLRIKDGSLHFKHPVENGVCFKYKEIRKAKVIGAIFQAESKLYFGIGYSNELVEFDQIDTWCMGPYSEIKFILRDEVIRKLQVITPLYRYLFLDGQLESDTCEPILHISKQFSDKEQLEKIKNGWSAGIPYWVATNSKMTIVETSNSQKSEH